MSFTTMSCACNIVLFLCCVFIGEYVSGNLIKTGHNIEDVTTKDIQVPRDENLELNIVDDPAKVGADAESPTDKKCVEIGQFCMNHSDCCTNACLGYMKKCVSG